MQQIYKLVLIMLVFTISLDAQQLPLFTQYRENFTLINPSIVAMDRMGFSSETDSKVGVSYRHQWDPIWDGPRTMSAQYEHYMEKSNMVLGGSMYRDQTGPINITGLKLRYAYQVWMSRYTFWSIGVSAGYGQYQFRGDEGIYQDPGDILGFTRHTKSLADFSVGTYFNTELHNRDIFYAGASVPQTAVINFGGSDSNDDFYVYRKPHMYAMLGYYKYLGDGIGGRDGALYLEPSIWMKYIPNAPFQPDLNLRLRMNDLFWVGCGYSFSVLDKFRSDNVHLEAGVIISNSNYLDDQQFIIGIGYDNSLSSYGQFLGNTYEINVSYAWSR